MIQRQTGLGVGFLLAFIIAGCGGSGDDTAGSTSGAGGGAGSGGGATEDCAMLCDKATACTGDTIGDICDPALCADLLDRLRDEISVGLVACAKDTSQLCESDWSACLSSAAMSAGMRPIDSAYTEACMDLRMTCSFADDLCLGTQLYDEALVAEAQACLSRPCDEVVDCIHAALGGA